MKHAEFQAFVDEGYNRIPVYREVLADLDTPVSAYMKLAKDEPYACLLESVVGGAAKSRYSIICLPAHERIEVRGDQVEHFAGSETVEAVTTADPLAYIDALKDQYRSPKVADFPFTGGLVGYFGFETVRYIEPRLGPCTKPDEQNNPDIMLLFAEHILLFDNLLNKLFCIVNADTSEPNAWEMAQERLDDIVRDLREQRAEPTQDAPFELDEADFKSAFGQDAFKAAIARCKDYFRDGDAMQVVLSQRMSVDFEADGLNLYRILRMLNPSPYMYYMNMGDFEVAGASPEILVRVEDQKMQVRPIAGTRPRGKTPEEDDAFEAELMADPKEIAEHLMLIDLGRNDVGRVAKTGSVDVTDKMVVERYSHVMHIVSNVYGDLEDDMGPIAALKAAFPAGTLSGAPKVRALEIIDELEPVKRGIYGGAVGYIDWTGNMDTAIAIRTAVIKNGKLYLQAGAGLVADSDPEMEWQETLNKARAVMRAVRMVGQDVNSGELNHD